MKIREADGQSKSTHIIGIRHFIATRSRKSEILIAFLTTSIFSVVFWVEYKFIWSEQKLLGLKI